MWSVVHDGAVHVRSWYRRGTGWNAAAARRRRARVHLAEGAVDVRVQDVGAADPALRRAVDEAYRRKYGGDAVEGMVSDVAAATTLRLLPAA